MAQEHVRICLPLAEACRRKVETSITSTLIRHLGLDGGDRDGNNRNNVDRASFSAPAVEFSMSGPESNVRFYFEKSTDGACCACLGMSRFISPSSGASVPGGPIETDTTVDERTVFDQARRHIRPYVDDCPQASLSCISFNHSDYLHYMTKMHNKRNKIDPGTANKSTPYPIPEESLTTAVEMLRQDDSAAKDIVAALQARGAGHGHPRPGNTWGHMGQWWGGWAFLYAINCVIQAAVTKHHREEDKNHDANHSTDAAVNENNVVVVDLVDDVFSRFHRFEAAQTAPAPGSDADVLSPPLLLVHQTVDRFIAILTGTGEFASTSAATASDAAVCDAAQLKNHVSHALFTLGAPSASYLLGGSGSASANQTNDHITTSYRDSLTSAIKQGMISRPSVSSPVPAATVAVPRRVGHIAAEEHPAKAVEVAQTKPIGGGVLPPNTEVLAAGQGEGEVNIEVFIGTPDLVSLAFEPPPPVAQHMYNRKRKWGGSSNNTGSKRSREENDVVDESAVESSDLKAGDAQPQSTPSYNPENIASTLEHFTSSNKSNMATASCFNKKIVYPILSTLLSELKRISSVPSSAPHSASDDGVLLMVTAETEGAPSSVAELNAKLRNNLFRSATVDVGISRASIYIYGLYVKHSRTMAQSPWFVTRTVSNDTDTAAAGNDSTATETSSTNAMSSRYQRIGLSLSLQEHLANAVLPLFYRGLAPFSPQNEHVDGDADSDSAKTDQGGKTDEAKVKTKSKNNNPGNYNYDLLKNKEETYNNLNNKPMVTSELYYCAERYKFHSAGREDIDVRMLGGGRPFVLELLDTHHRHPMKEEEEAVTDRQTRERNRLRYFADARRRISDSSHGLIEVPRLNGGGGEGKGSGDNSDSDKDEAAAEAKTQETVPPTYLRMVSRKIMKELHGLSESKRKWYRCVCHSSRPLLVSPNPSASVSSPSPSSTTQHMYVPRSRWCPELLALDSLREVSVKQATPLRVLHRRSLLVRDKIIHTVQVTEVLNKHWFVLNLEASAGMYIKEFCHGDMGRTKPSLADLLTPSIASSEDDVGKEKENNDKNGDAPPEPVVEVTEPVVCDILQLDVLNVETFGWEPPALPDALS